MHCSTLTYHYPCLFIVPPIVACNPEEFQGIKWPQTLANETAHVDCDPTRIGNRSISSYTLMLCIGSYTRDCIVVDSSSGKWSDTVISNCRSRVLVENLGKVNFLNELKYFMQMP